MDLIKLNDKNVLEYIAEKGNLIPSRCVKSVLIKHGFYHYIMNRYSNNTLSKDDKNYLKESIYRIYHNIEEPPRCKMCGSSILFKNNTYTCYCSRKCANSDPSVINKISQSCSLSLKKAYEKNGDEIKEKRRDTLAKKYGVYLESSSPFAVKQISDFAKNKIEDLYGVKNIFQTYECRIKRKEQTIKSSVEYKKNMGIDIEYLDNGNILVHNCCPIHGSLEYTKSVFHLRYHICRKDNSIPCYICNPISSKQSGMEKNISNYIKSFYFGVIVEHDHTILKGLEIDIYLPEIKVGFEFNGDYWHMNPKIYNAEDINQSSGLMAKDIWEKDNKKLELSKQKGIELYYIWESDLKNEDFDIYEYIKNIILSKLNYKNDITFCDISKKMLVDWCLRNEFPGTEEWESEHPIWDSYLPNKLSPRQAWYNDRLISNAVNNLFWVLDKSIRENKHKNFVNKHLKEFQICKVENSEIVYSSIKLLRFVLNRFTIAKIAPKVTSLSAKDIKKILDDSDMDISNGVYLPMAGFGGIKNAVEMWFEEHNIPKRNDSWNHLIEAYDINQYFCDWYGWTQKDMLSDVVVTDKICICCPPFGKKYEHWKGTPNEMSDTSFKEWYHLIKKHVISKDYIIIGPEVDFTGTESNKGLDKSGKKRNCLFSKTHRIMRWDDVMIHLIK